MTDTITDQHTQHWIEEGPRYEKVFNSFEGEERYRYDLQEKDILSFLERLAPFDRVLEFGCGYGRITKRVLEHFPDIGSYDVFDVSPAQVAKADLIRGVANAEILTLQEWCKKGLWDEYDLVLGVEVLLHVPPMDIVEVIECLQDAGEHFVHVDQCPVPGAAYKLVPSPGGYLSASRCDWSYVHPYRAIHGGKEYPCGKDGLQRLYHSTLWGDEVDNDPRS